MTHVQRFHERPHPAGPEPGWNESWGFDFFAPDGSVGGYVDVCLHPNLGVAWYWASLVGPGRQFVTVVDHEVPLPRRPGSLELRAEGLWADHTCETALDHWSLANEAFAVGLERPADAYGRMLGDQVPLGFDLEWETAGRAVGSGARAGGPPQAGAYEVSCRVHGEVLVGREHIDVDGYGQRGHRWGRHDRWAEPWCRASGRIDDGTRFQAQVADGTRAASGYVLDGPGAQGVLIRVTPTRSGERLGADGLPLSSRIELEPAALHLEAHPLALAPVLVGGAERPQSRLPRALCRFVAADGRTGHGWAEWNQPLPAHADG